MEPAPAGTKRFIVKSKLGMGRDFEILDENEQRAYFVDGKFGVRPAAEVQDASGSIVYKVRGRLLGIPKQATILDAQDNELATIKSKFFSPIKSQMDLETVDGHHWRLEGNIIEREYTVTTEGRTILAITQKWLTVRDAYTMDVDESVPPALAAALIWAVDAFREQK
jgi:uncharacterized protein YxjI